MALPPEPLNELLPRSSLIVVAVVVAVLSVGQKPPVPESEPGATSVPYKTATQKVRLKIERTLKGKAAGQEIEVEKPSGAYLLEVGNKGPFFIDDKGVILGRYGPDTHRAEDIVKALPSK